MASHVALREFDVRVAREPREQTVGLRRIRRIRDDDIGAPRHLAQMPQPGAADARQLFDPRSHRVRGFRGAGPKPR
jgi:hypothetical protein